LNAGHVHFVEDKDRVRAALARPVQIGGTTVGNSMAIHPMEGCDGTLDGRPGELTRRRYERFATGGAKLIWFEATAIREDGRANSRQLWLNRATQDDFARLLARMRALHLESYGTTDDLLIPVQLTVSGRYAYPKKTIAYHHPLIDDKSGTPADYPVISDDELERIEDDFVVAAGLALEAGFTALDIKATHGYLLSELLGARGVTAALWRTAPDCCGMSFARCASATASDFCWGCDWVASTVCHTGATRKRAWASHTPIPSRIPGAGA
jgi:2,4-dienoyl-CoA reductase-like NADH-dependent reductase (Old Yellow Enzyme family)